MPCSRNLFKIMAIIFMVIDHIGVFLLNDNTLFRIVGRLAFPMFVYLLADGFRRTKDLRAYFLRIASLYVISIIPYSLAVSGRLLCATQNVYGSLFLYLILYCILNKESGPARKNLLKGAKVLVVVAAGVLAVVLHLEYSWYGVLIAVIMFHMHDLGVQQTAYLISFASLVYGRITGFPLQVAAGFSVFFVPYQGNFATSPKPTKGLQWVSYLFYPVHLLFFAILQM